MSKITDKKDVSKLSPQEREALAEELYEKALDYKKRNHDDPEESDSVVLLDRAIELFQKPKYYYIKAHELFWLYSNMDDAEMSEEWNYNSPYRKPINIVVDDKVKYQELFKVTSKALELNPKYSQAYYMNARIYNQVGEYAKALTAINEALVMRSDIGAYYEMLYEVLFKLGDLDGALVAINKAYDLKPDGYRLAKTKCGLLMEMARYQEALEFIKTLPGKGSYDPITVNFDISIPLLIKLKQLDLARDVLYQVISSDYMDWELYYLFIDLYEQKEYGFLGSILLDKHVLTLRVLWVLFWANIHSCNFGRARELMAKIEFSKNLTTELSDYQTVDLSDLPSDDEGDSDSSSDQDNKMADSWRLPSNHLYSISRLFSLAQPYEKVPMDIFLLLLRKIFNSRYAKQYFIDRTNEFRQKWETDPVLILKKTTYGEEFYDISLKIMLLGEVAKFVYKLNKKKSVLFSLLQNAMNLSLMNAMSTIMIKVQLEERNRILANLSHSIKNMLKSVIDPLINLREELPQKAMIIDNAIKGANLIREIVNAINLSFKTTIEELQWDVLNPGKESMTLQDMIRDSLSYSVSNMFDFRYFPTNAENYFPRSLSKSDFNKIKEEWGKVSSGNSIDDLMGFTMKNMFNLEIKLDASKEFHVGNEKSSAIKLMILFQEIIFNAVKYSSFVPFKERTIAISLEEHEDKLRFAVKNSFSPDVQAKTTGVGKLVIENFAKVLDCQPVITTDDKTFMISMEFTNIWRNNAKNPVH